MNFARCAHRVLAPRADRRGWNGLWRLSCRIWGEKLVVTKLHGSEAMINFANPYPMLVRKFPEYNNPQVAAVREMARALSRGVHVVDVGAAVGDTALKLYDECGPQIASMTCIEGDPKFASLLRSNVGRQGAIIHERMLAASDGLARELIHNQHAGTAASLGARQVPAITLDHVLGEAEVDVLKIDTDGYDGNVLEGASNTLARRRPIVLFEWHPIACALAGTDVNAPFRLLKGYSKTVWYTKYGSFSHVANDVTEQDLSDLARVCRESSLPDWHYDVIAVPDESPVSIVALAATTNLPRA